MNIVAIDPGTHMGICYQTTDSRIIADVIDIKGSPKERVFRLKDVLLERTCNFEGVDIVVVEDQWSGINRRVGIEIAVFRGWIEGISAMYGVECHAMAPKEPRKILLGNGNAKKKDMQRWVELNINVDLSHIKNALKNNATDAIALYIAYERKFVNLLGKI